MPSLHSFILKDPERKLATLWLLKTGVAGGPEFQGRLNSTPEEYWKDT